MENPKVRGSDPRIASAIAVGIASIVASMFLHDIRTSSHPLTDGDKFARFCTTWLFSGLTLIPFLPEDDRTLGSVGAGTMLAVFLGSMIDLFR